MTNFIYSIFSKDVAQFISLKTLFRLEVLFLILFRKGQKIEFHIREEEDKDLFLAELNKSLQKNRKGLVHSHRHVIWITGFSKWKRS